MRRLFLLPVAGLASLFLVATLPACGDPCEDLQDTCDLCTDTSYQTDCQAVVDNDVQGVCSGQLGVYQSVCKGEEDAGTSSSSTSSAGGSGSTTTSSSTSGTGGSGGTSTTSGGGTGGV